MQQKVQKNMNSREEFEGKDESDDIFYADIRRQVMQLTEEEDEEENKKPNKERGAKQQGIIVSLQPGVHFNWTGLKADSSCRVPQWILDLWRKEIRDNEGFSGTGVFIPHIVKSRRRHHKQRRKNNERGRVYKPVAKVN